MPILCIRVRDEKYHIQMNILTFVRIVEICSGKMLTNLNQSTDCYQLCTKLKYVRM